MLNSTNEENRLHARDMLLLFGLVFVAFGTSFASNILTDDLILARNARAASWSFEDLSTSFRLEHPDYTAGWLPEPFNGFSLQYFRPLVIAAIKMDVALWGSWTPGYHLTNLLIYCVFVWLVVLWGRDFGLNRRDRLLLGALFVLYAPNQMAVNLIASRTELIADVFLLASVIGLGRFYTSRNPLHFAGALLAGVLALGSKENSVMLPVLHAVAALFLYVPGSSGERGGIKIRVLSILPFVLMVPCYFWVRSEVLGGFPEPLKGFYFHHPLDPGFTAFLVSKLIHAALTLIYQFPVFLPPVLIEYSIPTAVFTGLIAIATLVAVYRFVKPPFRYFMLFWVGACIAPTLPMGLNPIYYFMCSPVIAVFYVLLYRKYSESPVPRHTRLARIVLVTAMAFGLFNCIGGGIHFRLLGAPSRTIAEETIEIMASRPAVESVYLLDLPHSGLDVVPAIRFRDESHSSKSFYLLAPRAHLFDPATCEVTQVDAYAFDIRPLEGVLFRTGIEQTFLAKRLPEFRPGMKAIHPEYEIEVVEAEPAGAGESTDLLTRIRNHYQMPPASQNGISVLRFRFDRPLASADRLFLQVTESGVREIEFLTEAELSETGANPVPSRNPS